jgi:hypothetical protein
MTHTSPDVYQQKAIVTRARRAAADKRYAATVAQRRVKFQERLDAIVAAKAAQNKEIAEWTR